MQFYDEEEVNLALEDDELSAEEEAFMRGYMETGIEHAEIL